MYIQDITIEGFKSYAHRVVLQNFDPAFNAITGLNGTGKSNVLDSICFVLGLKNLSQVRAGNLQDLVYKQGQAGITKASVSITFKNDDPKTSPAGYEDKDIITVTRQIVVGGRNKYHINGHIAQENRVADFFHSVQLNVNNPHFLIMQGMILKVLNMKPPEILSLLEEAAGTRMYEKKKEGALKTLEKKEDKIAQIDAVLRDDILPSLETLRRQCGQYEEWAKLESRSQQLRTLLTAWEYTECHRLAALAQAELDTFQASLTAVGQKQDDIKVQISDEEGIVRDLQTEKEIQMGGEVRELQAQVDKLSMELTTTTTHWKSRCSALDAEKANLASLQASAEQLAAQDLPALLAQAEANATAAQEALGKAQEGVEAAQRELAGAEAGDGRDHTNRTLAERLADTQRQVDAADAEAKAASVKAKLLTDQLASSKKALAACGKEAAKAQTDRAAHQKQVDECRAKIEGLGYDAARVAKLEGDIAAATSEVRSCRDTVERLSQDVEGCIFKYTPPGGNFDARRVHGVLAKLLRVNQPSDSLALEVAAGGKLYQIVVEDDGTAKQLLEKGRLTRRVTIIPLNKIQYPELSHSVRDAAEKLGGGKAKPAMQLVAYEQNIEPAVKYAFGTTFVCQDSGTAKKLAFSREVNCRCVTLEGDDFNPSGLLTGGTRNASKSLLSSLRALLEAEERLNQAQQRLGALQAEMAQYSTKARQYSKLEQELALAQHSLVLLEERLAGTQAAQLAETCEQLAGELEAAQSTAKTAAETKSQLQEQCKALEKEASTLAAGQKGRIKAAQDKIKAAKAEVDRCKSQAKACEAAAVRARAELEGAASEQESLAAKITEATAACQALVAEAGKLEQQTTTARDAFKAAEAQLQARRSRLKECDSDITSHEKALAKLRRQLHDTETELRKAENKVKIRSQEVRKFQDAAAGLEQDYPWILRDKAQFGTGDYDFSKHNMKAVSQELTAAVERCQELKGKVNPKVISALQKAESDYKALTAKRETVDKDRERIKQVIEELDEKKREAMQATWKHVDKEFGAIFTTLLPGTEAKLEPPEGETFEAGLEVRVAFGGVWKTSLTELSGGQRSLLALSLILALCKFKPAPLYILDEVDSALDLNHTQNIGAMIRNHFPNSQFLIVSLKEGMFSNANVIFRTKFVDGVSNIIRTVPSPAERALRGGGAAEHAGKGAEPARAANRRPLAVMNQ